MKLRLTLILILVTFCLKAQWVQQTGNNSNRLNTVFFTDVNTGYIADQNGVVQKTTNGGSAWSISASGVPVQFYAMHFPTSNTGYIVGSSPGIPGFIFKTTDAGQNWAWDTIGTGSMDGSQGVYFTDASTGYVVDIGGKIKKTIDGGTNFTLQYTAASSLRDVYFIDANIGYAVGHNGIILKTTNGGGNWSLQTTTVTGRLWSVNFLNADTGYVAGDAGTVLKTIDGGANWVPLATGIGSDLSAVFFTSADTGYATSTGDGIVLKTTNGGASWATELSLTGTGIQSIFFPSSSVGYACGDGGIIYKTGGINALEKFDSQNSIKAYPNPVHDKLYISAAGNKVAYVKVFNNQGSVVQGKKFPSVSEALIDVSFLEKGIYFISITTDDGKSSNKKVAVVK
ncbi:MAG: T9SS type A sorting domain-containing protein [Bacteroidia bacterium]